MRPPPDWDTTASADQCANWECLADFHAANHRPSNQWSSFDSRPCGYGLNKSKCSEEGRQSSSGYTGCNQWKPGDHPGNEYCWQDCFDPYGSSADPEDGSPNRRREH